MNSNLPDQKVQRSNERPNEATESDNVCKGTEYLADVSHSPISIGFTSTFAWLLLVTDNNFEGADQLLQLWASLEEGTDCPVCQAHR